MNFFLPKLVNSFGDGMVLDGFRMRIVVFSILFIFLGKSVAFSITTNTIYTKCVSYATFEFVFYSGSNLFPSVDS